jgi:hypothetical protein
MFAVERPLLGVVEESTGDDRLRRFQVGRTNKDTHVRSHPGHEVDRLDRCGIDPVGVEVSNQERAFKRIEDPRTGSVGRSSFSCRFEPCQATMVGLRLPTLIVVMFAVVACGSDQSEPAEAEPQPNGPGARSANELIAESLQATGDSDSNGLQFTSEEADCAADAIAAGFDTARLEDLGLDLDEQAAPELTQPPLTTEEGDIVYRAFEECVDIRSQVSEIFASDPSLDEQAAACVADQYLASGLMREALLDQGFDQDLIDRIDAALADAIDTCST